MLWQCSSHLSTFPGDCLVASNFRDSFTAMNCRLELVNSISHLFRYRFRSRFPQSSGRSCTPRQGKSVFQVRQHSSSAVPAEVCQILGSESRATLSSLKNCFALHASPTRWRAAAKSNMLAAVVVSVDVTLMTLVLYVTAADFPNTMP